MKTNRLCLAIIIFVFFFAGSHLPTPPTTDYANDITKSPQLPWTADVIAFEKAAQEYGLKWLYTEPFIDKDLLIFMHVFRQEKHNPYEIEGRFDCSGKFYRILISGIRDCRAESFKKTTFLIKALLQMMQADEADIYLLIERLFSFCKNDSFGHYDNCSTEIIGKGESFLGKLFIKVLLSPDIFEIMIINIESEHIKAVIKNNKP